MKRYLGRVREVKKNVYNISLVTHLSAAEIIVKKENTRKVFLISLIVVVVFRVFLFFPSTFFPFLCALISANRRLWRKNAEQKKSRRKSSMSQWSCGVFSFFGYLFIHSYSPLVPLSSCWEANGMKWILSIVFLHFSSLTHSTSPLNNRTNICDGKIKIKSCYEWGGKLKTQFHFYANSSNNERDVDDSKFYYVLRQVEYYCLV